MAQSDPTLTGLHRIRVTTIPIDASTEEAERLHTRHLFRPGESTDQGQSAAKRASERDKPDAS